MKKKLPRLFLAAMTALSLWGAWLCPVRLALPAGGDASEDILFSLPDGSTRYVPLRGGDFAAYLQLMQADTGESVRWVFLDEAEKPAFLSLLRSLELRKTMEITLPGFPGPPQGWIWYIHVSFAAHPYNYMLRVCCADGQTSCTADANGHCYEIRNPAPLLEFLQERVPVPA